MVTAPLTIRKAGHCPGHARISTTCRPKRLCAAGATPDLSLSEQFTRQIPGQLPHASTSPDRHLQRRWGKLESSRAARANPSVAAAVVTPHVEQAGSTRSRSGSTFMPWVSANGYGGRDCSPAVAGRMGLVVTQAGLFGGFGHLDLLRDQGIDRVARHFADDAVRGLRCRRRKTGAFWAAWRHTFRCRPVGATARPSECHLAHAGRRR